ncbi:MAG: CsgG/HfaB family protein [Calditrichia bacterium]
MRKKPILKQSKLALIALLAAIMVLGVAITSTDALTTFQSEDILNDAIENYNSANYDAAINALRPLADDEGADLEHRKDALRYLGRCYVATRHNQKAKAALEKLIVLEPPLIEFDPDRESPPLMKVYYQARKKKSNSYQLERKDPGIKTIAIMDFRNSSITDKEKFDPMEKGFSDILISRLNGQTDLKVVERERLQWIIQELEIQNKYGMEGAVRAGKQLGVHVVVFGSYIIVDDKIWLSARLVKVESSEILFTTDVKGKPGEFFDLTEQLSQKIRKAIDGGKLSKASGPSKTTNSLEAILSYSEGLELLERGEYADAHQKFQKALEHDPGYEKAKLKSDSIKDLLIYSENETY